MRVLLSSFCMSFRGHSPRSSSPERWFAEAAMGACLRCKAARNRILHDLSASEFHSVLNVYYPPPVSLFSSVMDDVARPMILLCMCKVLPPIHHDAKCELQRLRAERLRCQSAAALRKNEALAPCRRFRAAPLQCVEQLVSGRVSSRA